ncbi:MAG: 2,3-bisphosphoglycerate-independent phosphoglycerate mutase [Firmicutes bacterium]|nr:2,3-bisphosphoglycerate-independent phosphoglycerate mutase [Bacillota bacterium]
MQASKKNKKAPVALIIMDGFGNNPSEKANAIFAGGTPNLARLSDKYVRGSLQTSGLAVGLPQGMMGNSEVGHLNIGAGRVVYQDLTAIDKSIAEGAFFENDAFLGAVNNCKSKGTALHLMGLLSDGGVHSSIEHLYALLQLAKDKGVSKVWVHALMDGRDVPPTSGGVYVDALQKKMEELGVGCIATVVGRYYLMDRDNRWERVQEGYESVFEGKGPRFASGKEAVDDARAKDIKDEFVKPCVVGEYKGVAQDDSVIFFNFRSDRAREISRVIVDKSFEGVKRADGFKSVYYVGMTEYDASLQGVHTAFAPKDIKNTLGEFLAIQGLTQARVAETEKYAHVTFFFNGGVETPNQNETRVLVPSPKVATYDLQPEMSAPEVLEKCIEQLESGVNVLIVNFANCDMVGHTGVFEAAKKAVQTVDACVGKLADKIVEMGGSCLISADHGNAEQMQYEDGSMMTSHTTFDVPLLLVGKEYIGCKLDKGALCDIAPTLIQMLGLKQPKEMTGKNLILKQKK